MKPITKWNARVNNVGIGPEVVRKAVKGGQGQKPGPAHLELPEDVMESEIDADPLPSRRVLRRPEPSGEEIGQAAELIGGARAPIVLAGNGVQRVGAAEALREFARITGIKVAETFMGKGSVDNEDGCWLGAVGLQAGDYEMAGFDKADVVITVGFDLVEHSPEHWNPNRDKRIVCIDTTPVEVDEYFVTDVDLIGDMDRILRRLTEECGQVPGEGGSTRLRDVVLSLLEDSKEDGHFPMQPPRALHEIREALGREDILVSDVGLHKLWIGRMFPAHEPNTVLVANGFAGMGFATPAAIAAKLVHPERHVVAVNGDGGFLMNMQELETAKRLGTNFVTVIWENRQYGSIVWKQDKKFGEHFGVDFTNPDFVKLAEAFGMPAWRCGAPEDFGRHLRQALSLDLPSLIVLPIDYSLDVSLARELGDETLANT